MDVCGDIKPGAQAEVVMGAVEAGLFDPSIMASLIPPGLAVLMAEDEEPSTMAESVVLLLKNPLGNEGEFPTPPIMRFSIPKLSKGLVGFKSGIPLKGGEIGSSCGEWAS